MARTGDLGGNIYDLVYRTAKKPFHSLYEEPYLTKKSTWSGKGYAVAQRKFGVTIRK